MKYLIELVADPKGLEPAITAIEKLTATEKELKTETQKVSDEQKKMMDAYASKAKLGKDSIDKLTEGYKNAGKAATGAFGGNAIAGAAKQAESFRTQLKNSREELIKLMVSGKATTSQIYEAAKGAGHLKDNIGDAQQAISVLASDTFKLDAALQGVQVVAAGFQVLTGAAALLGVEDKELQKTLVKLNAVMAITNGLKQIQDGLQKQTALSLDLNVKAQKAYTFVVGTSTGILKAFRIALAATGIGLIVIALGALVANWDELSKTIKKSFPALNGVIKFFENFKQYSAGAISAVIDGFKVVGTVIGDIFKGNFSKAVKDASQFGKIVSEAFNKGYNEEDEKQKLIKKNKDTAFNIKLLEAQGKEVNQAKLALFKDELTLLEKNSDEYNDKLIEIEQIKTDIREENNKKALEAEKKRIADKEELYMQEIQIWKSVASELDEHSIERFQIEKNIAENEKKIALLNAKTDSDRLKAENDFNDKVIALRKNLKVQIEEIKPLEIVEKGSEEWYQKQITYWEGLIKLLKFGSEAYNSVKSEIDALNESLNRLKNPTLDGILPKTQGKTVKEEIAERIDKEKQIADATIQIAKETSDTIFTILNQRRNDDFNAKINDLERAKNVELSNKNLTENQKARIEERYQKKIADQKRKQAEENKKAAILQAVINGALAITNILATMNWSTFGIAQAIAIGTTIATTAAQIAVISAQRIPQFAKGTEFVMGAGTETSDSVPAMLSRGERVVDAKTNKLLKGIPNKMLPDMLMPSSTLIKDGMDYDKLAKAFSKELANNPALMVNFDKNGFTSFIKSGVTTSQIKNNRNGI